VFVEIENVKKTDSNFSFIISYVEASASEDKHLQA